MIPLPEKAGSWSHAGPLQIIIIKRREMESDRERCYRSCADAQLSLHDCKRALGLLPGQCYPSSGYNGRCDANEFGLKKCLAFAANERDARVLYDTSQPRKERADANRRLQARLRGFNVPCTP